MSAPAVLAGSRDPRSGACYQPPRALSVDGHLHPLEDVDLPTSGVLAEFVAMGPRWFGYVDLDGGVRLVVELGDGPHEVGARYRWDGADGPRRFLRA